jgi:N-acetylglutamate synthase-like GNAT family acetyltransferase
MFRVEKMRKEHYAFAVELSNTMNWNMTLEDFTFNAKLEPGGCFILRHGSELIGVATCISYGRIGWFGNLIVKEAHRRKGAGTLLVKHAVGYLKSLGVEAIGLYAYRQLIGFYESFGFKRNADFAVLKAQTVSSKPEGKLKTIDKRDMAALLEFDTMCFGGSRKKLLEPILLDPKNPGYFSVSGVEIDGYAAAKVFAGMAEVGPMVCRRKSRGAAVALLKTVVAQLRGLEAWMCAPTAEADVISVAAEAGFREEFGVARMFLGSVAAGDCVYVAESLERG